MQDTILTYFSVILMYKHLSLLIFVIGYCFLFREFFFKFQAQSPLFYDSINRPLQYYMFIFLSILYFGGVFFFEKSVYQGNNKKKSFHNKCCKFLFCIMSLSFASLLVKLRRHWPFQNLKKHGKFHYSFPIMKITSRPWLNFHC